MEDDVDKATTELANDIRETLGEHISKFDDNDYKEALASCIMALYAEVGRLRWLSCETGEVTEESFDKVFLDGVMRYYKENKTRLGGDAH